MRLTSGASQISFKGKSANFEKKNKTSFKNSKTLLVFMGHEMRSHILFGIAVEQSCARH